MRTLIEYMALAKTYADIVQIAGINVPRQDEINSLSDLIVAAWADVTVLTSWKRPFVFNPAVWMDAELVPNVCHVCLGTALVARRIPFPTPIVNYANREMNRVFSIFLEPFMRDVKIGAFDAGSAMHALNSVMAVKLSKALTMLYPKASIKNQQRLIDFSRRLQCSLKPILFDDFSTYLHEVVIYLKAVQL